MNAGVLLVVQRLLSGDPQGPFLGFDRQISFAHAGQLDDRDEIVLLLEDIDRRITPHIGSRVSKPVARQSGFELLLEVQQGFERIGESHDHCHTSFMVRTSVYLWRRLALSRGEC
jgi:hypothetical protein